MRQVVFSFLLILNVVVSSAQDRLITRNGSISFYSKTPLEDIEAVTQTAMSVLDKKTGRVEFMVLIKSFAFEKALMQEHFNENYLESSKFPKASFNGRISDMSGVDFSKDGNYVVAATGDLTIHGVTQSITTPVTISVRNGIVSARTTFSIALADYKISIPALVSDKISKTIRIAVNLTYQALAQ